MAVWQERISLYKVGFFGVIIGTVLFVVGFCTPAWFLYKPRTLLFDQTQSMGLWQKCTVDLSLCRVSIDDTNPGWLKAVRALESVSMFFSVVACVIGCYCNCVLKAQVSSNVFSRNVETSAIVSVTFGSFGLVIFAIQVQRSYEDMTNYSWGFVLVCAAHSITCLSAFVMMLSTKLQAVLARRALARHHQHHRNQSGIDHFPTHSTLPDFLIHSDRVYITSMEHQMDMGPPPYETVVNCIPQEEPAPPPYSQVVGTRD